MKHKLLSLFALAGAMFMSTSVWAQKWDAPVKPTLNEVNAEEVVSGKTYYFKNVGAGQFLTGGNSWATQASFTWKGMDDTDREAFRILVSDSVGTIQGVKVTGVTLKLDGSFHTYGTTNRGAHTVSNTFIFRENETNGFVDRNGQDRGWIWKITKAENGYYRIQTSPDDTKSYPDAATQYAGWDSTNGPIEVAMNEETKEEELVGDPSTQVTFNLTADDENAKIDWMLIEPGEYLEALKVYDARKTLYDALVEGDENGIDEAVLDAATVVYNNAAATIAELGEQTTHVKAAIARLKYEAIEEFQNASNDNPQDVTEYCLVNPDFEAGNISGWTTNYVSGKQANNIGYQGASYTNGDVTISKFIEAWKDNSAPWTIGDGYLQQTVFGLPKGKYVLKADAISNYQHADHTADGGIGKNPAEGVFLFIQAGSNEVTKALATGNGKPEHFEVTFVNEGADELTFGLKTVNATANWIAADNFKIDFYGETTQTQGQLDLQAAIDLADALEAEAGQDFDYCYAGLKDAWENAYSAAVALMEGELQSEEVYIEAAETLTKVVEDRKASIELYQLFAEFLSDTGTLAEYEQMTVDNGWDDLSGELSDWHEELEAAYADGTYTNEQVTEAVNSLKNKITEWIAKEIEGGSDVIKEGTDLTILLDNPSFNDGTNGWTIEKDGGNTGSHCVDDDVDYPEIEFWRSQFDIYQVIENMPAGAYEITVQGFSRNEDDQLNPDADIKIELYAGDNTAKFMNLLNPNQVRPVEGNEPLFNGTEFNPNPSKVNPDRVFTIDGVEYYAPNGMGAAYVYFQTINENTGEPYYTNHVKVTLKEAGDFRIGVRSFNKSEWTLFDNFKITYLGSGGEVFAEMADQKFEELSNECEKKANIPFLTKAALEAYATISMIDRTGISSIDEYNAFAAPCDTLIAYIKEGTKLGSELYTLVTEDYNGRCVTAELEGFDLYGFKAQYITPYTNRLDKVEPYQDFVFEDNDAYLAVPVELATAWTEEIQAQADDMTFGNNTLAIFGNDYMSYADATKSTLKGWSMEKNDTVTFGNYLANEFVAEVFSPKGEYTHYQEILGLEPGYYRVTVDGYFRPGDNLDEMTIEEFMKIKRAYMFGESTEQKAVMPLKNVLEGAQTEALGGSEKTYTLKDEETGEDVTVYTPNDVAAAYAYFQGALVPEEELEPTELEDEDLNVSVYRNTITLEVGEDGVLTIGISNVGNGYVTNDWACFSNWTLSYMGTEVPDGIASVQNKTQNAPAVIYTIDGRQASRLQRGLNIVRNADGKVQKIMVK